MSSIKRAQKVVPLFDGVQKISRDKYELLFDHASDAILAVNENCVVDTANLAFEELSGYRRGELLGSSLENFVPHEMDKTIPGRARPFSPLFFKSPGTYEDIAILKKDGSVRVVELSVALVGSLAVAIFRDVTEKKKLEQEVIAKHAELKNAYFQLEKANAELKSTQTMLVQAGKMAALGELTAGISHELNQPLQAIKGFAQESKAMFECLQGVPPVENATIQDYLKEVVQGVDKMSKIIEYLRTFTSKSVEKFEEVDLHHTVEDALKMLDRQLMARGIAVERKFDQKIPKVFANPIQLEQVFINLATNARDAIEATGRGRGKVTIQTQAKDQFIEIRFTDDGVGMSEVSKSKAFNPFFTTKEVGKGMGLGLSLSYGILSKLHGSIVVESEVGKGTTFIVRVPQDFRKLG